MQMYITIKVDEALTDGKRNIHLEGKPLEEEFLTFEVLHKEIGGWIEAHTITFPTPVKGYEELTLTFYCDEEGRLKGLPVNEFASLVSTTWGGPSYVGNVVICGDVDENGEQMGLDVKVGLALMESLKDLAMFEGVEVEMVKA